MLKRSEFNRIVAERLRERIPGMYLSQEDAKLIIDTILETVAEYIERGEEVYLGADFGKFIARQYPPARRRNPATGELIELSSRRVVQFRPSRRLAVRVREPV